MLSSPFQRYNASNLWFPVLVIGLIALRFLHLGEIVDEPHSWRQCDTANYIWAFYQDGIDLFHPSVCWMGGHKTTILEFPLPEALIAVVYKILGPNLLYARLIFLLIFLGGVRYFYLIVKMLDGKETAEWASLFYLVFPLGIYYSRAIHVDFTAIFFAHAMVYHFMRGIRDSNSWQLLLGGFLGGLGFMVKSPYLFYLFLPLLAWVHHYRKWKFCLRNSYRFLLPLAMFIPWQQHVHAVNNAAPDWDFIPHYRKFVNMWGWYFGGWEMRTYNQTWLTIYGHVRYEILTNAAWWPSLVSFLLRPASFRFNFLRLWALGTFLYVLIFFNLNVVHNYYQLPLLAPFALSLALLTREFQTALQKVMRPQFARALLLIPFLFLGKEAIRLTEQNNLSEAEAFYYKDYYRITPVPTIAGPEIRKHTPEDALVIVSYGGFDPRTPLILYRARRNGWSIPQADLSPELVQKLMDEGATYLAAIPLGPLPEIMGPFLVPTQYESHPLPGLDLKLDLYRLQNPPANP